MYEWLHAQAHDLENWNCLKGCVFFVMQTLIKLQFLIYLFFPILSLKKRKKKKNKWNDRSKLILSFTLM